MKIFSEFKAYKKQKVKKTTLISKKLQEFHIKNYSHNNFHKIKQNPNWIAISNENIRWIGIESWKTLQNYIIIKVAKIKVFLKILFELEVIMFKFWQFKFYIFVL